jgi:hypothetical protein
MDNSTAADRLPGCFCEQNIANLSQSRFPILILMSRRWYCHLHRVAADEEDVVNTLVRYRIELVKLSQKRPTTVGVTGR